MERPALSPQAWSRMPTTIADNLQAVHTRIAEAAQRAGRDPGEVRLMAVSKTQPAAAVREAYDAGQRLFGENYVQEALDKMAAVGEGPQWHLIGHLQRNKARQVPGAFTAVQSLDAERTAAALQRHAEAAGGRLQVYLQANLSGEASKTGVPDADGLRALAEAVRGMANLELCGLMTIPAPDLDERSTRAIYAELRRLLEALRGEFAPGPQFRELSMGMSHDYAWAIAEGATLVRVGTAIFGARAR